MLEVKYRGEALTMACVLLVTLPTFLCYGYNLSVAGALLTQQNFLEQFPQIDTTNTSGSQETYNSNIQGTVISLFPVGGIFGALISSAWGDVLGRRVFIFFSNLVTLIGAVLMASSFHLSQFIVARVVLGIGIGAISSTIPVWTSEIASTNSRGASTSLVGMFMPIGISLGFWVALGLSFVTESSVSWRFPLALQILFCIWPMITICILPESPRWLLTKGRQEEARDVLSKINDCDPHDDMINTEVSEIVESLEIQQSASFKDMFTMGESRTMHRAALALFTMLAFQITGINAITFFANVIFEQYLKMGTVLSKVLSGCMSLLQVLSAGLASMVIDRFGRRPLFFFSGIGMSICMILMAGLTSDHENIPALKTAVFALFAINFIYSVGFAGCCFCYSAEISPIHLKSLVNGIAVSLNWIMNFVIAMVTPTAFSTIDYAYYIIWAVVNGGIILPVVFFFFPETKRRSLEELDELFLQSQSFFDTVKIAKRMPHRYNEDGLPNKEAYTDKDESAHVESKEVNES
jgi:sugar porter (SP) family MFS transporter